MKSTDTTQPTTFPFLLYLSLRRLIDNHTLNTLIIDKYSLQGKSRQTQHNTKQERTEQTKADPHTRLQPTLHPTVIHISHRFKTYLITSYNTNHITNSVQREGKATKQDTDTQDTGKPVGQSNPATRFRLSRERSDFQTSHHSTTR